MPPGKRIRFLRGATSAGENAASASAAIVGSAGEAALSGGPMSKDYGIGLVGQLKVLLLDTEPAELATDTVTVGRLPREQRPV